MRNKDDECCDANFHCPECDGHRFGLVLKDEWIVECHNDPCDWSGPYDEHVKLMDIKGVTTNANTTNSST